ncbi:MAG: Holliday junction resolvase-like protein [Candidatus Pacearchaeota archaeon]
MDLLIIVLILLTLFLSIIAYLIGYKFGSFREGRIWESKIPKYRKEAIEKSRSVLTGQFSEQLAPYFPNFPYSPTECKFIGKPIDFIIFKGSDEKNIEEVIFLEIKSKNSKLSSQERNLKKTIENRRVRWEEYRI